MPWLMCLVADLSPWMLRFDTGQVYMVFVVDKLALGQVFLQVLRFSPISIIPLTLHNHLHLNTKETNKQAKAWEPSKKAK